ncbi:hypothetical protein AB8Z38_18080 [Bradyrhizobium sp. LLZ17]|uniref:Uncharacterized protein n=1 Tax=Bradyrhizobium sp. LLZ17 TaxID=3239388 RepID=A0AB39XW15_9BRAD
MMARDRRRDRECGCDRDAQRQGPIKGDGDLTSGKHQRTTGRSHKQRAGDAGAALQRNHPDTQCDEKRQRIHSEREDRPAEQAHADGVEDKPKGEHGGGSTCIDLAVAPSTTTTGQFWM